MANKNPSPATRFKKGETGNPGGKPVGARDRITKRFLYELAEDFEKHGADVIRQAREQDPTGYLRICAALVPKEMNVEVKHGFTDILKHLEAERRAREAAARSADDEHGEKPPVR